MKRFFTILWAAALLFALAACGSPTPAPAGDASDAANIPETKGQAEETAGETLPETVISPTKEPDMLKIEIAVGETTFTVTLCDNETAKTLSSMLPLTLQMSELNGNEKYFYLKDSLPAAPKRPDGIHAGDLMLYGDDCIVLFYESFSTAYSYTPIGSVDDPAGLAQALGSGSVTVTFRENDQ